MTPSTSFRTGFAYEMEAQRRVAHARTELARAEDALEQTDLLGLIDAIHRRNAAQRRVEDQLAWAEEFEVKGGAL